MKKLLLPLLLMALQAPAQTYQPTWESLDSRPVPQWYRDVKFGIFIHWGVYSVPAFCSKGNYAEWYQHALKSGDSATVKYHREKMGDKSYYELASDFKAELFNPEEWAQVFEKSGARYIVLTSKHHDGFANWPSREASKTWGFPWNAAETGPHRDLLGDLFAAVRKTKVHPGMYYSLYEWYNPLWLSDKKRYVEEHMWPQAKDLINRYHPDVFWTDGEWDGSEDLWKSKELLAWMYNESPVKDQVVTYDRWGSGVRFHHGGVYTPEYQPDLDFENHPWEESRGMGFSYGYNREEDAWDYNSAQSLVLQLVDKVSRGGNFLLDIGPDEHGKIPPIMQERLLQMGHWMDINAEAIYNTRRWRIPSQWSAGKRDYKAKNGSGDILLKLTTDPDPGYAVKECFFTYNPSQDALYAILPKWPSSGSFTIQDLTLEPGTRIELLETHQALSWKQQGNQVLVQLPAFDPNILKSEYAYVLKLNHTGAFTAKPAAVISYPNHSLTPLVTLTSRAGDSVYYTLDGSAPDTHARLYTEPFVVHQSSQLSLRAYHQGELPSDLSQVKVPVYVWKPAVKTGKLTPGLALQQYLLSSPNSVEEMDGLSPSKSGTAAEISLTDLMQKENAGLVYSGYIKIPADGIYRFSLSSDDGSRLWLDGELTIDNDGLHGAGEITGQACLKKGYHRFRLAYFQATGDAGLQLKYSIGSEGLRPVPKDWFVH